MKTLHSVLTITSLLLLGLFVSCDQQKPNPEKPETEQTEQTERKDQKPPETEDTEEKDQEEKKQTKPEFTVKNNGFSIIRDISDFFQGDTKEQIQEFREQTGTALGLTIISPDPALVSINPGDSRITISEDREKILYSSDKQSGNSKSPFYDIRYNQKQSASSLLFRTKKLPSSSASKLHLKGTISVTTSKETQEDVIQGISLTEGATFQLTSPPLEGKIVSAIHPKDETHLEIRFKKPGQEDWNSEIMNRLKDIKVIDQNGDPIQLIRKNQSQAFPQWNLSLGEQQKTAGIKLVRRTNFQRQKISLDRSFPLVDSEPEQTFSEKVESIKSGNVNIDPVGLFMTHPPHDNNPVLNPFSESPGISVILNVRNQNDHILDLNSQNLSVNNASKEQMSVDLKSYNDRKSALVQIHSSEPENRTSPPLLTGDLTLKTSPGKEIIKTRVFSFKKGSQAQTSDLQFTIHDRLEEENLKIAIQVKGSMVGDLTKLEFYNEKGEIIPARLLDSARSNDSLYLKGELQEIVPKAAIHLEKWKNPSQVQIPFKSKITPTLMFLEEQKR